MNKTGKTFLTIMISVFAFVCLASAESETDKFWENRNSRVGALENFKNSKAVFLKNTNYANAWKFARAAYFYGDNFEKDIALRKEIFSEGKKIAEISTNLGYQLPEGHYYLAVCIGMWAEANGIINSLFAAPDILKEASKSVDIDPNFENAGSLMLRARVYQQAPGVISVGDVNKSRADYEKVLELAPNNRVAHRFYAELLIAMGNKGRAKEVIGNGLAIPFDSKDSVREENEINLLKELQKKI